MSTNMGEMGMEYMYTNRERWKCVHITYLFQEIALILGNGNTLRTEVVKGVILACRAACRACSRMARGVVTNGVSTRV